MSDHNYRALPSLGNNSEKKNTAKHQMHTDRKAAMHEIVNNAFKKQHHGSSTFMALGPQTQQRNVLYIVFG